jgi:hypothetical protein
LQEPETGPWHVEKYQDSKPCCSSVVSYPWPWWCYFSLISLGKTYRSLAWNILRRFIKKHLFSESLHQNVLVKSFQ